jgi:hypothetical protein
MKTTKKVPETPDAVLRAALDAWIAANYRDITKVNALATAQKLRDAL